MFYKWSPSTFQLWETSLRPRPSPADGLAQQQPDNYHPYPILLISLLPKVRRPQERKGRETGRRRERRAIRGKRRTSGAERRSRELLVEVDRRAERSGGEVVAATVRWRPSSCSSARVESRVATEAANFALTRCQQFAAAAVTTSSGFMCSRAALPAPSLAHRSSQSTVDNPLLHRTRSEQSPLRFISLWSRMIGTSLGVSGA